LLTTLIAFATCLVLVLIARPLLFASLDDAVAAARGVPVRLLGLAFLVLVGVTAAESTQVVGALLILGLMAAPAAAAIRLTTRPFHALLLSGVIAVASVWIGLAASYAFHQLPPSFTILAVASLAYVVTVPLGRLFRSRDRGPVPQR